MLVTPFILPYTSLQGLIFPWRTISSLNSVLLCRYEIVWQIGLRRVKAWTITSKTSGGFREWDGVDSQSFQGCTLGSTSCWLLFQMILLFSRPPSSCTSATAVSQGPPSLGVNATRCSGKREEKNAQGLASSSVLAISFFLMQFPMLCLCKFIASCLLCCFPVPCEGERRVYEESSLFPQMVQAFSHLTVTVFSTKLQLSSVFPRVLRVL